MSKSINRKFFIKRKFGYMECNIMRELNVNEIEKVSGGFWQFVVGAIAGPYIYDSIGGKEGIDSYLQKSYLSARAAVKSWF